mmetsp:Transcript_27635/g.69540  ORF Transcript_27635/g.69540 Transcript_27635/m.69540 type:complete len:392 (+) Transcript_27635:39-1214(+)
MPKKAAKKVAADLLANRLASAAPSGLTLASAEASGIVHWAVRRAERPKTCDNLGEDRCFDMTLRAVGEDGEDVESGLVAVLDGHGGSDVADFVASILPRLLLALLASGQDLHGAASEATLKLDAFFEQRQEEFKAGTCLNYTILAGTWLCCVNVGDCRSCFVDIEDMTLTWLSRDHQAKELTERRRIESLGGQVSEGCILVDGIGLEPSRTLGDWDLKKKLPPDVISAKPELRALDLREHVSDKGAGGSLDTSIRGVLITASDGLWRHLADDRGVESVDALLECVKAAQRPLRQLSHKGSGDAKVMSEVADSLAKELLAMTDCTDDVAIQVAILEATWSADAPQTPIEPAAAAERWGLLEASVVPPTCSMTEAPTRIDFQAEEADLDPSSG